MNRRLGTVLLICALAVLLACAIVLSADEPPTLTAIQKLQSASTGQPSDGSPVEAFS